MSTTNEDLVENLNDLVEINNDRIRGYERAIEEVENIDVDLKSVFAKMADQSREIKAELTMKVSALGGEIAEGTTARGKVYRAWMDLKATFSGNDRQTALNSCEFGEDAAQRAYTAALASDDAMDTEVRQMIVKQQSELKTSHDAIKAMRDANKAVS